MGQPKHDFGTDISDCCMSGMMDLDFMQSGEWLPETDKSSRIDVIPSAGFVKKIKQRSLDATVYETMSTLFFSELLNLYTSILPVRDVALFSPQTVRIQYGDETDKKSRQSALYQIICPGRPLNKIKKTREKILTIDEEPVRIDEKTMYLGGIMYQIMISEGIMHGDPQLRHFFMMPIKGQSYRVVANGGTTAKPCKNGLGVIDVEHSRILGMDAQEVKQDAEKFRIRIYKAFNHTPKSDRYFCQGSQLVKATHNGNQLYKLALKLARSEERRVGKECRSRWSPYH